MKPSVLLALNLSPEREKDIYRLALRGKVRFQRVGRENFGKKLGAVLGLAEDSQPPAEQADFDDELLVLCHMEPPQMSAFLNSFREAGVAPVRLKAVLTDTNAGWTFNALHKELAEEDAWFKANKGPKHGQ